MNRPDLRPVLFSLAAMLAMACPALADKTKPDAEARALLDEVVKTYQGLNTYADSGQFAMAITINDNEQKQEQPMALTFVRPNKIDLNLGAARLVSDGETVWTVISPTKKYTEEKAPAKLNLDTFKQGPVGALLLGGPTGMTQGIVLALLTDDNAAKIILEGTDGLRLEADREVDGQKV
ncbi:MAG: peroxiredoxin, partial [Isosphaeraceae bacterium]